MKRRTFLGALLTLIASPVVAKLPAPAPIDIIGTGELGVLRECRMEFGRWESFRFIETNDLNIRASAALFRLSENRMVGDV